MVKLNKNAKIGEIYKRRDGKECVYLGEEKDYGRRRFKFRLLEEHIQVVEQFSKSNLINPLEYILPRGPQVWDISEIKEFEGDWHVRFNGRAVQGIEVNRDIIEKKYDTIS